MNEKLVYDMIEGMRSIISAVVLTLLLTTGCSASRTAAPPQTIDIAITADGVKPSGGVIKVGLDAEVTLNITATHDDVVHLHGYNKEIPIKAGEQKSEKVKVDKPGRYQLETHNPALIIAVLDIS